MCEDNQNTPTWEELRLLSIKLRSVGHLIETQDPEAATPDDMSEVVWGLGMILNDFSYKVRKTSRALEDAEIAKTSSSKARRNS